MLLFQIGAQCITAVSKDSIGRASGLEYGDEILKYLTINPIVSEEYQLPTEKIAEVFVKAKKQNSTILLFIRRARVIDYQLAKKYNLYVSQFKINSYTYVRT